MFQNCLTGNRHGNGKPQVGQSVSDVPREPPQCWGKLTGFETPSKVGEEKEY